MSADVLYFPIDTIPGKGGDMKIVEIGRDAATGLKKYRIDALETLCSTFVALFNFTNWDCVKNLAVALSCAMAFFYCMGAIWM